MKKKKGSIFSRAIDEAAKDLAREMGYAAKKEKENTAGKEAVPGNSFFYRRLEKRSTFTSFNTGRFQQN